jgi:hypothetical protein
MVQLAEVHQTLAFLHAIYQESHDAPVTLTWARMKAKQMGIDKRVVNVLSSNQLKSEDGKLFKWIAVEPSFVMAKELNDRLDKKKGSYNRISAEQRKKILEMYANGVKIPYLQKETGLPYATVYGICKMGRDKIKDTAPALQKKQYVPEPVIITQDTAVVKKEKPDDVFTIRLSRTTVRRVLDVVWKTIILLGVFTIGWFGREIIGL